jgi:hypothetical protein
MTTAQLTRTSWVRHGANAVEGNPARPRQADKSVRARDHGPPPADGLDSFVEAQRRKENYLARLRQLEFEVKSGRLVDAATVRNRFFALARENREAMTSWPAQVAPLIAAQIGADQVKLAVALDLHVRKFLADRARLHRGGDPGG